MGTTIDWDGALNQVADDEEFLQEVLGDLQSETEDALATIKKGMSQRTFTIVMKAAHQIKGSAAYLCCTDLQNVAKNLQMLGNEGVSMLDGKEEGGGRAARGADTIWVEIGNVFAELEGKFGLLRIEIGGHTWAPV